MELPDSLPAQLYLLTYNPETERMAGRPGSGYLGPALRAAALVELLRRGRIVDESGKVAPALDHVRRSGKPTGLPAAGPGGTAVLPDDPILLRVLEQIEGSGRRRSWAHWIGRDTSGTTRCARDYLESGRWIRVERDRVAGIFPRTTVTVRDTVTARTLIGDVRRALVGSTPVDRVGARDRQLAALGVLAEMGVLFPRKERRAYRGRARELAAALGPAADALRKAISTQKASSAG